MMGNPNGKRETAPFCIAVFEDNPALRRGMQQLLGARGCEVVVHDRSEDAPAFVRRHRPAVVVVDLHFDGRDAGLRIVQRLRQQTDTAQIPIIVWSTDPDVGKRVDDAGLNGIMVLSKHGHASMVLSKLNDLAAARTQSGDWSLPESAGNNES